MEQGFIDLLRGAASIAGMIFAGAVGLYVTDRFGWFREPAAPPSPPQPPAIDVDIDDDAEWQKMV